MRGRDVCLLVSYAPQGVPAPAAISLANALVGEDCLVRLCLNMRDETAPVRRDGLDASVEIITRRNAGYDFAAWSHMLKSDPQLWQARRLIFANDSLIGPFAAFPAMMRDLRACEADFIGLVESFRLTHHYQSFFFAYQGKALQHEAIRSFWNGFPVLDHKSSVIRQGELQLLGLAQMAGLSVQALFSIDRVFAGVTHELNPAAFFWERLLLSGFPFLKADVAALLFHGPRMPRRLRVILEAAGADISSVERQLAFWSEARASHRPPRKLSDLLKSVGRQFSQWRHDRRKYRRAMRANT